MKTEASLFEKINTPLGILELLHLIAGYEVSPWQTDLLARAGDKLAAGDPIREAIGTPHGEGTEVVIAILAVHAIIQNAKTLTHSCGVVIMPTFRQTQMIREKVDMVIGAIDYVMELENQLQLSTRKTQYGFEVSITRRKDDTPVDLQVFASFIASHAGDAEMYAGHIAGKLLLVRYSGAPYSDQSDAVLRGYEGDSNVDIYFIGPPSRSTSFARVLADKENWESRTVDARECAWINAADVSKMIAEFGENSSVVQDRVFLRPVL